MLKDNGSRSTVCVIIVGHDGLWYSSFRKKPILEFQKRRNEKWELEERGE
jgi:hypothetical protein